MKYAILGDIHSNYEAFKAVLKAAENEKVEKIICTGDLIGYGADPVKCVNLMKKLPLEVYVAGNHEEQIFSSSGGGMNKNAKAGILYTKNQLSDEEKNWIYETACWSKKINDKCAVAHGSFYYPEDFPYLGIDEYNRRLCHRSMRENDIDLLFVGHTHTPYLMPKDSKGYPSYTDIEFIDVKKYAPCIVDVGSVGQPRDRDTRASYAVYDSDENIIIRHRIEYDVETAASKIVNVGLPRFLADRLREGK